MKRSLTLVLIIIAIFSVCVFSASAQQVYTEDELTFSVPDMMENDAAWAAENDYTYAFYDEGENIELCVSVYENDGFSNIGMDEESLANYASSLEDYFVQSGYTVTTSKVEAYKLANGYEGVEVTIALANGEKGNFYWFTTDRMCYDLDFYIYDEAYEMYVDQVMNSVAIVASATQSGTVVPPVTEAVPPVTEEVTDNSNDFIIGDEYAEEPADTEEYPYDGEGEDGPEIYTVKDLTIEIPALLDVDSYDGTYKLWKTDDIGLFVEVNSRANSDDEMAADFKEEDFKLLYANIAINDDTVKELLVKENVKINGFKGIKLVYRAVISGLEYKHHHYFFATKDTVYEIIISTGSEKYEAYVDSIINTVKIDSKPLTNTGYYIYIVVIVLLAVLRIVSKVRKNKKAKKNAPATNNTPNYFNPDTDAYGAQYNNNQNNGYVENNGYAPDYNYSNNLDTTLTNTSDFSKTEYRNATAGMEKNASAYEEE